MVNAKIASTQPRRRWRCGGCRAGDRVGEHLVDRVDAHADRRALGGDGVEQAVGEEVGHGVHAVRRDLGRHFARCNALTSSSDIRAVAAERSRRPAPLASASIAESTNRDDSFVLPAACAGTMALVISRCTFGDIGRCAGDDGRLLAAGQDVLKLVSHVTGADVHLPRGCGRPRSHRVEQREREVLDADEFLVAAAALRACAVAKIFASVSVAGWMHGAMIAPAAWASTDDW